MVTQQPSLSNPGTDPLRNFKFLVTFTPNAAGVPQVPPMGFMTVQGLTSAVSSVPYQPGGLNSTVQNIPLQAAWGPITLTKGVICTSDPAPIDLQMMGGVMSYIQGGSPPAWCGSGNQADFRYGVDIQVLQHPVTVQDAPAGAWFHVYNAWCSTWTWADLDAGANELFISQIILTHGGFDAQYANSPFANATS